jgi:hypothetical protein
MFFHLIMSMDFTYISILPEMGVRPCAQDDGITRPCPRHPSRQTPAHKCGQHIIQHNTAQQPAQTQPTQRPPGNLVQLTPSYSKHPFSHPTHGMCSAAIVSTN